MANSLFTCVVDNDNLIQNALWVMQNSDMKEQMTSYFLKIIEA